MASRCYHALHWHNQAVTSSIKQHSSTERTTIAATIWIWSVICQQCSYTCIVVISEMRRWPVFHSLLDEKTSAMCIRRRLTRTGGWVGPKEHHQEVSPAGCSVASYKAHTHYTAICIMSILHEVFVLDACAHARARVQRAGQKFHSEGNLTQEGKGQWKLEEKQRMKGRAKEKEPPWVGCWCHSQKIGAKMGRKWEANNRPLSLLTLPCFFYLSHTISSVLLWQVHLNRLIKPPVCHIDPGGQCATVVCLCECFVSCVIGIVYRISTVEKCFFFSSPASMIWSIIWSIIKTFPCACVYLFSCKWRMEHSACNSIVFTFIYITFLFLYIFLFQRISQWGGFLFNLCECGVPVRASRDLVVNLDKVSSIFMSNTGRPSPLC